MQAFISSQQNQTHQMGLVEELELETISTDHLLSYIIHDTFTVSPPTTTNICPSPPHQITTVPPTKRKRRPRRAKACKNKEEAETQRMTHIAVERNRRKLMNEHLAILKSLMPESYIHRGDQASIVGGAIEYVKELEHLLQTLEAQKLLLHGAAATPSSSGDLLPPPPPFSQFFLYPQYMWTTTKNANDNNNINMNNSMVNNNYKCTVTSSSTKSNDIADIEVNLIETHANVRILSRRSFSQLSKMVAGFYALFLSILHLNVTTVDSLVLYSISAKVEEGCQLTSADDIAGAVYHMLRIIEDEISLC